MDVDRGPADDARGRIDDDDLAAGAERPEQAVRGEVDAGQRAGRDSAGGAGRGVDDDEVVPRSACVEPGDEDLRRAADDDMRATGPDRDGAVRPRREVDPDQVPAVRARSPKGRPPSIAIPIGPSPSAGWISSRARGRQRRRRGGRGGRGRAG
jgi:hypothetical protein